MRVTKFRGIRYFHINFLCDIIMSNGIYDCCFNNTNTMWQNVSLCRHVVCLIYWIVGMQKVGCLQFKLPTLFNPDVMVLHVNYILCTILTKGHKANEIHTCRNAVLMIRHILNTQSKKYNFHLFLLHSNPLVIVNR